MATINAGVLLSLKDTLSNGIRHAGSSVQSFASGATNALQKVDKAFSGIGTAMGAIGVSLSVGAATRDIIDLDDKMSALGVQANISAEKVNELKSQIFETALAPDVKLDTKEITAALDSIVERTGDVQFAESNMRSMALAIRATGASGADIGGLYAEFQKMGLSAEEAKIALDTLTIQGKEGAFTLENLATLGPRTINAYTATGRSGEKALREMGAALQVIRMGTGSSEQAATAFEAVMRNLTSPDKQAKLRQIGVAVRDDAGEFRSITEIMQEVIELSDGNSDMLGTIFDAEAMRAFNYAIGEFKRTGAVTSIEKFNNMLGDGSTIQSDAARRAETLKANITGVQTAFLKFADKNLTSPLLWVTEQLNKLSENPENFERIFKGIAAGIAAIAAIKLTSGVVGFIANLSQIKSGKIDIGGSAGSTSGMPVYVTNWGGGSISAASQQQVNGNTNVVPQSNASSLAILSAVTIALQKIPQAIANISEINKDETLSKKQKASKTGGEIGETLGTIAGTSAGTVAGVKLGAVIGSMILPGIGTAVGAGLGGLGGYLLGKWAGAGGRDIGERLGEAITKDDIALPNTVSAELESAPKPPETKPTAELTGNAQMDVRFSIDDYRTSFSANMKSNTTPLKIRETGSVHTSREAGN